MAEKKPTFILVDGEKGVVSHGNSGGEIQAGDPYGVRFWCPEHLAYITVVWFVGTRPGSPDDLPRLYWIVKQVELDIVEKEGDSPEESYLEDLSYYDYDIRYQFDSLEDAEYKVRRLAERALREGPDVSWNGQDTIVGYEVDRHRN